jgi:hypothetical protein
MSRAPSLRTPYFKAGFTFGPGRILGRSIRVFLVASSPNAKTARLFIRGRAVSSRQSRDHTAMFISLVELWAAFNLRVFDRPFARPRLASALAVFPSQ